MSSGTTDGTTLLLDTSGSHTTVVVAAGEELLGTSTLRMPPLTHLHGQVRSQLEGLGLRAVDLGRIAVVTGPGSWTGLNIGVTAAKTLAQVLEAPLVGLSALEALVADLVLPVGPVGPAGPVVALLDAKRGNVYRVSYEVGDDGRPALGRAEAEVVAFEELAAELEGAPETPLVVEYGDAFRERLETLGGKVRVLARLHLTPEGLLRALGAAGAPDLTGEEALTLSPRYLQRMV